MVDPTAPKASDRACASFESERLSALLAALEAALAETNRPLLERSPWPGLSKLLTHFVSRLLRKQSVVDQRLADVLHLLAVEVEAQRLRIERLEDERATQAHSS